MTRTAGTLRSCMSGGSAKPSSSTRPTRTPCTAGSTRGAGSSARDDFRDGDGERLLRDVAEGAARARRRRRPGSRNSTRVQAQQLRLRGAEAAHHRAAIEMALDEAARAERDRHAGEHRGEQRGEAEEALRAVDRRAHFGTPVSRLSMRWPRASRGCSELSKDLI